MPKDHPNSFEHLPVLVQEVIDCLQPQAGESYLDLTAGYGGHAERVLSATKAPQLATLVDRDAQALRELAGRFGPAEIIHQDFLAACQALVSKGRQFDLILADLGVSSPHLNIGSRGFAIRANGPLDMRMDQSQALSADQLVNSASQEQLAKIIAEYGEEPKARAIAQAIVQNRPISGTEHLAKVVATACGPRARATRIHPATKTFQALRIAVNDELAQLENSLPLMEQLLAPGGRLAIISFHSLEDRIVKRYFADNAGDRYDAELRLLTKKPLTAGPNELVSNPRARSAKLRAAAKIKQK